MSYRIGDIVEIGDDCRKRRICLEDGKFFIRDLNGTKTSFSYDTLDELLSAFKIIRLVEPSRNEITSDDIHSLLKSKDARIKELEGKLETIRKSLEF
jgi:hypothetical protein